MPPQQRRSPLIYALEPRVLLDGAVGLEAAATLSDLDFKPNDRLANDRDGQSAELLLAIAPSASPAEPTKREWVFIDASLPNHATLVAGVPDHATLVLVQAGQDGWAVMAQALANQRDIDAVHVIGHGSSGAATLGSSALSADNISGYTQELAAIGAALASNGDLLLYGCEVGQGEQGEAFVNALAQLTQADIAASDDLTGASDLGGDWELESRTGLVETTALAATGYNNTLVSNTITFTVEIRINNAETKSVQITTTTSNTSGASGQGGINRGGAGDVTEKIRIANVSGLRYGQTIEVWPEDKDNSGTPSSSNYSTWNAYKASKSTNGTGAYGTSYTGDSTNTDFYWRVNAFSNRAPSAGSGSVTYNESGVTQSGSKSYGLSNTTASDADGDSLSISGNNNISWTLTPDASKKGLVTLSSDGYTVSDGMASANGTFYVKGRYADDPTVWNPTAKNLSGAGNLSVDWRTGASDPDASDTITAANYAFSSSTAPGGDPLNGYNYGVSQEGSYTVSASVKSSTDGNAAATRTFGLTIANANDAPTAANGTASVLEDAAKTFATSDFSFADADQGTTYNTLDHVLITSLPANGTLLLDGNAVSNNDQISKADLDAARLTFAPNEHWNGTTSFQFKVSDGLAQSVAAYTMTINVTSVADAPVVSDAVTNEDTQTTSGLVLQVNPVDLANNNTPVSHFQISNIVGGSLLLADGTTAVADGSYITVAAGNAGLKFTPSTDLETDGSFDVKGATSSSGAGLGPATGATIVVTPVNDALRLDLDGTGGTADYASVVFSAGGTPVLVTDADATLLNVDTKQAGDNTVDLVDQVESLTAVVAAASGLPDAGHEVLALNTAAQAAATAAGLVVAYDASTFTLTVTGAAADSVYQTVLRGITYQNTLNPLDATPNVANRVISITANDGDVNATTVTSTIDVVYAPLIDLNGSYVSGTPSTHGADIAVSYTEDSGVVSLASASTVVENDSDNLNQLIVTLHDATAGALETILISGVSNGGTSNGVTVTYDSATQITLSGAATAADYQNVLRLLTYENADQKIDGTARNLTMQGRDVNNYLGNVATVNLSFVAVNDAPVINAEGSGNSDSDADDTTYQSVFIVGMDTQMAVASDATVSDVDTNPMVDEVVLMTATLSAATGGVQPYESLALTNDAQAVATASGLTVTYSSGTGVLTVAGSALPDTFQAIIRGLQYLNTFDPQGGVPNTSDRSIAIKVNDGDTDSVVTTTTMQIKIAPVIDFNGVYDSNDSSTWGTDKSVTYAEDDGNKLFVASGTVVEAENDNVDLLNINLTNLIDTGDESITIDGFLHADTYVGSGGTITINYASASEITLSGAAAAADYQHLVQKLVYANTDHSIDPTTRSITLQGRDVNTDSGPVTTLTVAITPSNDAPTVTSANNDQQIGAAGTTNVDANGVWTYDASGAFTDLDIPNEFDNSASETGAATTDRIAFAATLADGSALPNWLSINASTGVLTGNPPSGVSSTTMGIKVFATDVETTSAVDSFNLVFGAVNDRPQLTSPIPDQTGGDQFTGEGDWSFATAGYFTDTDGSGSSADTLTYTLTRADGSALSADAQYAWLRINASSGVISGNPPNAVEGQTLNLKVTVDDGSGAPNSSVTDTFAVAFLTINDTPSAGAIADAKLMLGAQYTLDASIHFADADANTTLTYTATGLPDGLTIDPATGVISGSTIAVAQHPISITASDITTAAAQAKTETIDYELQVLTPPPSAPTPEPNGGSGGTGGSGGGSGGSETTTSGAPGGDGGGGGGGGASDAPPPSIPEVPTSGGGNGDGSSTGGSGGSGGNGDGSSTGGSGGSGDGSSNDASGGSVDGSSTGGSGGSDGSSTGGSGGSGDGSSNGDSGGSGDGSSTGGSGGSGDGSSTGGSGGNGDGSSTGDSGGSDGSSTGGNGEGPSNGGDSDEGGRASSDSRTTDDEAGEGGSSGDGLSTRGDADGDADASDASVSVDGRRSEKEGTATSGDDDGLNADRIEVTVGADAQVQVLQRVDVQDTSSSGLVVTQVQQSQGDFSLMVVDLRGGDKALFSVTLPNGEALPDWLSIDEQTGRISASPPAGTYELVLRVSAQDPSGSSRSVLIAVSFETDSDSDQAAANTMSQALAQPFAQQLVNHRLAENAYSQGLESAFANVVI